MPQKFARPACIGALGIASAMAYVIDSANYVGRSDAPASSTSYLWCALALCFIWLLWRAFGKKRPTLPVVLLALFYGALNTLGGMLYAYDSWAMLASPSVLLLTVLRCIGQAAPMAAGLTLLHDWLFRGGMGWLPAGTPRPEGAPAQRSGQGPRVCRLLAPAFRRHPTAYTMLALLLCWSPFLIAFFPGTICWDLGEMAAQYLGLRELDTWHSLFLTWVFGWLVSLGRLLNSDNLGAALYMLLQTLALAYALSQAMALLRRLNACRVARGLCLAFFAFTPLWGGYAQFVSKDTLYTAALLLFTLRAMDALLCRERGENPSPRLLAGLFAWGLLSCLIRTNGLYVVAPSALALALFAGKGKARISLAAALAGAVGCALLFSNVLVPALGVKDETASGLYSVCFQQSARVLRDHADQVTPAEYAEIDRVLDAENLPQLYEPWISDPVKYTFRFYGQGRAVEKEALNRYMHTWRAMLPQYALSYAEAFFAGNVSYYAFTPKFEGASYNDQAGNRLVFETYDLGDDPAYLHTNQAEGLAGARKLLAVYARGWRHIPLLSLSYCCAAYTWLLAGAALSLLRQKRARLLTAYVPALMTLGVCLLSPVNDYFRYFLPVAAMAVPLLALAGRAPQKG